MRVDVAVRDYKAVLDRDGRGSAFSDGSPVVQRLQSV